MKTHQGQGKPTKNMDKRDPFGVWDGEKFVFTLRKISSIVGNFPIPSCFEDKLDTPIDELTHATFSLEVKYSAIFCALQQCCGIRKCKVSNPIFSRKAFCGL